MKQLTSLILFSLLSDPMKSKHYQEKLENAYEEFVNEILNLDTRKDGTQSVIRKLNFTRIELISLQASRFCEKGKKCTKNLCSESNPFLGIRTKTLLFTN